MVGYGKNPPKVEWPNQAKLALQIVLNYEEGGENCILHGDRHSETFLSEIIGAQPIKGRHMNMESLYEYGSRSGFWRLYKLFTDRKIPITIFGVAMALERNHDVVYAIQKGIQSSLFEVASHGWRWIDYQNVPKSVEKKHMKIAIKSFEKMFKHVMPFCVVVVFEYFLFLIPFLFSGPHHEQPQLKDLVYLI